MCEKIKHEPWTCFNGMERDRICEHEFTEKKIGNCLYKRVCKKCGAHHVIDSSG